MTNLRTLATATAILGSATLGRATLGRAARTDA